MTILLSEPGDIEIVEVTSTFEGPEELVCNKRWNTYVSDHAARGGTVWNSSLYRFEGIERDTLFVSSIEVREVLLGREIQHCPPLLNMFVACLPITTDGKIVLCRPSPMTTTKAEVSLIGGALSRDEGHISSVDDIVNWGERELVEEVNLRPGLLKESRLLGIVLTPHTSVGCISTTRITISSSEVSACFASRTNNELDGIFTVSESKLPGIADEHGGYLGDAFKLLLQGN